MLENGGKGPFWMESRLVGVCSTMRMAVSYTRDSPSSASIVYLGRSTTRISTRYDTKAVGVMEFVVEPECCMTEMALKSTMEGG